MRENLETKRLPAAGIEGVPWKKWGPYLSERQWGTVREDCSRDGNAWDYFSHDQARSRAYHRGEDGIAGISDDKQLLCFSIALWNGKDPILKERMFGLTNRAQPRRGCKRVLLLSRQHPTLWFRNTWTSWPGAARPSLKQISGQKGTQVVAASHGDLGNRYLYCEGDVPLLFTENETNNERIFGTPNANPYDKEQATRPDGLAWSQN